VGHRSSSLDLVGGIFKLIIGSDFGEINSAKCALLEV